MKKFTYLPLFIFAFALTLGCTKKDDDDTKKETETKTETEPKTETIPDATEGDWRLTENGSILSFTGEITETDVNDLKKINYSNVNKLIVNSSGGETLYSMEIGEIIYENGWNIEVDQLCASSCANYFFPSANEKTVLENAIVAFHGGYASTDRTALINEILDAYPDIPVEAQNQFIEEFVRDSIRESELYKKIGVDIRLLAKAGELTEGDNTAFWAPPKSTYDKVNVDQIVSFWFPSSEEEINQLIESLGKESGVTKLITSDIDD